MLFTRKPVSLPDPGTALPGRAQALPTAARHFVNGHDLLRAPADDLDEIIFALGCFWGAERVFWQIAGVVWTQVGYAGGYTPNPTYEEVCSGQTGHTEVVRIVYDRQRVSRAELLTRFWESHDPTQGMAQGNDIGTQYRSAIYTLSEPALREALDSKARYQAALNTAGRGAITTEIKPLDVFYWAEDYHQQYLAKNPGGYCGIGGTGIACPQPPAAG